MKITNLRKCLTPFLRNNKKCRQRSPLRNSPNCHLDFPKLEYFGTSFLLMACAFKIKLIKIMIWPLGKTDLQDLKTIIKKENHQKDNFKIF